MGLLFHYTSQSYMALNFEPEKFSLPSSMFKIIFYIILKSVALTYYAVMKNMQFLFKIKLLPLLIFLVCFHSISNAQNKEWNAIPNSNGFLLTRTDTLLFDKNDTNSILYYKLLDESAAKIKVSDYAGAINDATKAIELKPDFYKAYYIRSLAYSSTQDYENSFKDINTAIEKNSTKYELYYNRGILYRDIQQYELALKDLERTIELKNDFDYAYLYLGECYFSLNDYTKSITNFNKAIQLDSSIAIFYYSRSVYYSTIKNVPQEFNDLKKVISLDSTNSSAFNNLGYYYFKKNNLDSAIYYYNKAVQADKNNLRARTNRARAYENKKQYQLAIDGFTYNISVLPTEKYFYIRRSELYSLTKQPEKANDDMKMYNTLSGN